MNFNTCDICGSIIRKNEFKFMVYQQNLFAQPKGVNGFYDKSDKVEVQEICAGCKIVYNYIFSLRIDKVNKIKKEIEKSFYGVEETDYCKCGDKFEDEGLVISGEETGICYTCQKLKKPLTQEELLKLIEKKEFENE